jgi:hypothetical protein
MKTSALLTSLFLAISVSAAPQQFGGRKGGFGGFGNKGNANQGANNAGNANQGAAGNANAGAAAANNTGNADAGAAAAAAANNTGNANAGANNAGNGNAAGNAASGDPQQSTTLDPKVIATGFANDGQDQPTAGQVASLTSTNNFINFCLTVPNLPITNGKQIETGSCNPAPIGTIPSTDNMPSSKFTSPANGDTIAANQAFTVSMAIQNMQTGNFVNAQENYFAAPQQLNGQGQIIGHTHVVIETLSDLGQTTPTNPKQFAFFKGVNGAAQNGVVTADVTDGLPAAAYRMCSINAAANHQPVIVPIAQHGSLDDCVYFTASAGGAAAGGNAGAANNGTAGAANGNAGAANGNAGAANGNAGAANNAGAAAGQATATAANGAGQAQQQAGGQKGGQQAQQQGKGRFGQNRGRRSYSQI